MNFRRPAFALLLIVAAAPAALAQVSGGPPAGVNAAFARLFGPHTAFTASVDTQVLDRSQKEWVRLPMKFAALDGRIRIDIDLTEMRSQAIPASAVASYKQAGLHQITSIIRPDQKVIHIVYPGVQSYAHMPMSKAEVAASGSKLQVQTARLGEEVVDNQPCVKNRVVVRDAKGAVVLDAVTWNATGLKDFPVRIATQENGNTTVMRFHQVQFTKPDLKQFAPPTGYARYGSVDGLMFAAAKKNNPESTSAKAPAPAATPQAPTSSRATRK